MGKNLLCIWAVPGLAVKMRRIQECMSTGKQIRFLEKELNVPPKGTSSKRQVSVSLSRASQNDSGLELTKKNNNDLFR